MIEDFVWPESTDAILQKVVEDVKERGWSTVHVFGDKDGPGFAYTVGFWLTHGRPELIAFGLPGKTAHQFFGGIFRLAAEGKPVPPEGRDDDLAVGLPLWFKPVLYGHYAEHLGLANWFYASLPKPFPASQMVWPDPQGRFPWDRDFAKRFRGDQLDLWSPELLPADHE